MKLVKMLKKYGNNFAGERCGFPNEEAERLIAIGSAVPVAIKQVEEEARPPKQPRKRKNND